MPRGKGQELGAEGLDQGAGHRNERREAKRDGLSRLVTSEGWAGFLLQLGARLHRPLRDSQQLTWLFCCSPRL